MKKILEWLMSFFNKPSLEIIETPEPLKIKIKEQPMPEPKEEPKIISTPVKSITDVWKKQNFFTLEEIIPKDVYHLRGSRAIELFSEYALQTLIKLRVLFGVPININNWKRNGQFSYRGFRPWNYYTKQSYSQHMFGRAFDFTVKNLNSDDARKQILQWKKEGKLPYLTGLECGGISWVHIDTRICERLNEDGLFIFTPTSVLDNYDFL